MAATPITVAYGDGIGPEIMEATLDILRHGGAELEIETIEVGQRVYEQGITTGIPDAAWESLRRTKVFLKAPITTPQGGGYKSLNVTIRKALGLFANVRPCRSYHPIVQSLHPKMDMVIVRENEEDIYAGVEYRQTANTQHAIKLITHTGSERIARYAFEYARQNGRKKVTCMSKDNIMKVVDGVFHKTFDKVAEEYPDIETDHYIIDIGSARIASKPQLFDVIVTQNLYGDIISDIAADVSGSVGLAGSSNIGEEYAMFEAIHGSAPDIAGQDIANPSGLLGGAILMLTHIGQNEAATRIHNALLKTLEDGVHTGDIYKEGSSKQKAGTKDFAEAVCARIGEKPGHFDAVDYGSSNARKAMKLAVSMPKAKKEVIGVDLFADIPGGCAAKELGRKMEEVSAALALRLHLLSFKGLKVYPGDAALENIQSDMWRCRFMAANKGDTVSQKDIITLMSAVEEAGIDVIKTETLCTFDGERGYSLAQGE